MTRDCRHCHRPDPPKLRRGLCCRCYKMPAVRALYPPLSRGGRPPGGSKDPCVRCRLRRRRYATGLCQHCRDAEGPARRRQVLPPGPPTAALPGAEAKILALQARAAARQPLFVAGDARRSLA